MFYVEEAYFCLYKQISKKTNDNVDYNAIKSPEK